jgi:hypothetical protein
MKFIGVCKEKKDDTCIKLNLTLEVDSKNRMKAIKEIKREILKHINIKLEKCD